MKVAKLVKTLFPAKDIVEAHCDGPCGVYDPASARIAAEAALSMTKKLLALSHPDHDDEMAVVEYHNTASRYIAIKEEQAHLAKNDRLQVRFIEFMPFSGSRNKGSVNRELLTNRLKRLFPTMSVAVNQPSSTARLFHVPDL